MNHLFVHYKNKYPLARVEAREDSLDVYSQEGEHLVSVVKNGAGQWADRSEQLGCRDRHDLAPIPKDSRLYKLEGGNLVRDDKFQDRKSLVESFVCEKHQDRVLSCAELSKKGWDFDEKQRVVKAPKKAVSENQQISK